MELGFSLGGNLGDRLAYMQAARDALVAVAGSQLLTQSPIYETSPVGVREVYKELHYYNAVVVLTSPVSMDNWALELARIEEQLGRERTEDKNAPRTIDVDLIYADNLFIDSGGLIVPHPRWASRRFVLQPLADVRPDLRLPGQSEPVKNLLRNLPLEETIEKRVVQW
jgi:2-amino-4-hydroxy-6-hydroxymethyldihydropteridine diphosphokinase